MEKELFYKRSTFFLALWVLFITAHFVYADSAEISGSIQSMIDKANYGDTIKINGGVYKESLIIEKDVKLVGQSQASVILIPTGSDIGINIRKGAEVTIEGITIQCSSDSGQERPANAIKVFGSVVNLSGCKISGARNHGVFLDHTESQITDCIIKSNGSCGIKAEYSKITVKDCIISENTHYGIYYRTYRKSKDGAYEYELINNIITENKTGILVGGDYGGKITGCRIIDNESANISIRDSSGRNDIVENFISQSILGIRYEVTEQKENGVIKNNTCSRTDTAIYLTGENTVADVIENECSNNDSYGIAVGEGAQARIIKNICNENTQQGIYLYSNCEDILLQENECYNNKLNGIYITRGTIKAEGNICQKNTYNGISAKSCVVHLEKNNCSKNKGSGIYLGNYIDGYAKDNVCRDNRFYGVVRATKTAIAEVEDNVTENNAKGGIWQKKTEYGDVRILLKQKKFDELEETASRFKSEETRDKDGKWLIRFFYEDLSSGWHWFSPRHHGWVVDTLEEWMQKKPESITPYVVLSGVYILKAWGDRGGEWAYKVTDEGWEGFRENLDKALEVIRKAEKLEQKDAHLYKNLITAGMGLGNDVVQDEGLNKGIAVNKYYLLLYISKGKTLLPRWGGTKGQYETFADAAHTMTADREGAIIYARLALAAHSYTYPDFDKFEFSYEKIKQGHEDILKRYPDSDRYLNSYCLFACLNNDLEKAKELFEKIGKDYDYDIWENNGYLGQHYDWVFGENVPGSQ